MKEFIMAQQNGRNIPSEDKIFGISRLANEMIEKKGKDAVPMQLSEHFWMMTENWSYYLRWWKF